MLDYQKISAYIASRRKQLGMTQAELAKKLNVSSQAVSKWENGTLPTVEILAELADILSTSTDEILMGQDRSCETFSYSRAGIDISYTDAIKKEMSIYLKTDDRRVLNGLGPFASLYDIHFPDIAHPILVLKSEEPGSKQKLAMEYGYSESICHDMINHLVNDIAVMGARPLAVLDTIVCGNAEKDTIKSLIKGMSDACRENDCALVGGETSLQPEVVSKGVYILTSSIAGIASKEDIIDGTDICEGDAVLAVASNGLHTNGYTLIRLLMDKMPQIKLDKIQGETFIEQIMKPHAPYYHAIQSIISQEAAGHQACSTAGNGTGRKGIHGMAHITGGGIEGNLSRIIPDGLCAEIDLTRIKTLPLFGYIKKMGNIDEEEMLSTFNCGVGLCIVAGKDAAEQVANRMGKYYDCYKIGKITSGDRKVVFRNHLAAI